MISRWATGAALSAAAITLVACGGGSDSSTGPGGGSVLPSGAVSLAAGQSAPLTAATALKIDAGSSGSENVLVLVDTGLTSISAKANYSVAATGIGTAGAISPPATSLSPSPEASAASTIVRGPGLDMAFGMRLNRRSQARFRGGFDAARAALSSRRLAPSAALRSLASAPPQVGDIFNVNVGTDPACSNLQVRGARVVAISTQAIVLADTLNPTGGFTASDYQRFATRFDTLVYPLDVGNFGQPSDIDGNGKIILLFTGAVNELTPANSSSYVGGFFYGRDLFPISNTPQLQGCPGSNTGEMFYLLAPDPTGAINGNVRRTGFVDSVTTSVIAHEFEHLINASRRLYVTNATEFEEGWLDEGLAHIAEELLFYRESKLGPRNNIALSALQASTQTRNSFNEDMASNAGRYRSYLLKPSENSPFRGDDSLETRGATWSLLRYLADRKASSPSASDAPTWQALASTTLTGVANLSAVFGTDLQRRVQDWNIAHYTDDLVTGVPSEFTHPSWNFHNIYPALTGTGNTYPLKVDPLSTTGASGTLIGGAASYYRFSIPAGTTANLTLTAPGLVSARVIRVR